VSVCWVVGASIPAVGSDVPDVVGRLINPVARVFVVTRPAFAFVGVPRHAATMLVAAKCVISRREILPRVDDDGWVESRVALHPTKNLGVVMVGAFEPGVSRDGREDCQSSGGERVLHFSIGNLKLGGEDKKDEDVVDRLKAEVVKCCDGSRNIVLWCQCSGKECDMFINSK
jgi:hypothetical protein